MNTVIVACRTIEDELNMVVRETGCKYPILWIESGLHSDPDSLRKRLQEELNRISNADQVLMAFGFCGNSLISLTPPSYRMIIPRADDCITLLLGSCEKRREISDETGTYFLTKGWLKYEKNIWAEYQETVKRFGKVEADDIYETIFQNYTRLGIIETGAFELDEISDMTQNIAKDLKFKHQIIPGTLKFIKKLVTGPWNEEFIIINPGETISINHLYGSNKACP